MKKRMLLLIVLALSVSMVFGGEYDKLIEGFNEEILDTNYLKYEIGETANADSCYTNLSWVDSPVYEGARALKVDYKIEDSESWGGYSKFYLTPSDSTKTFDFSGYDTLSLSYYVDAPQSVANDITFRFDLLDVSHAERGDTASATEEGEYYYSFLPILDAEPGWNEIKLALTGGGNFGSDAFTLTGWTGINGNAEIDKDKIKSVHFEFSIGGSGDGSTSSGTVIFDRLVLTGASKVDLVFFNGKAVPSDVTLEQPWSGGVEVTDEEDAHPEGGTNSLKWNAGDAWAGPLFYQKSPKNMQISWMTDSVQFKIKGEDGSGALQVKFTDTDEGDGDFAFEATYDLSAEDIGYDGTWKTIKVALSDFNRNAGVWVTDHTEEGEMDSTKVNMFGIVSSDGNSAGKSIYLDDIWTGSPTFDLFPPEAPASVTGQSYPSLNYTLVFWTDVDGESGEVYDVYVAEEPITDVNADGVTLIGKDVLEGVQSFAHYPKYPLVDTDLDFYYAVVCKDAAGNIGEAAYSSAVTTTAKGVPTISLNVPDGFSVDGDFGEWYDSGIKPFVLRPEYDKVNNGTITDSTDLKATVWMAIDNDYLYVAAEIIDDSYYHVDENSWWVNDCFEIFIGLYNQTGVKHTAYATGATPDHKIPFTAANLTDEKTSGISFENGSEYYYFEGFDPDYVAEAMIPLDSLAKKDGEEKFVPKNGMRIPFELYVHDNDVGATSDNVPALGWSRVNEDNAHSTPSAWTYTFIGNEYGYVGVDDEKELDVATSFKLEQNYPNPFNPTTTINYSIAKPEMVKIAIYNVLGQKVAQLVSKQQKAGEYNIQWNAANLASGMYIYKLQAGNFVSTKKMLLMK